MTNLTRAHHELFRRAPDERYESLTDLAVFCQQTKDRSQRLRESGTEFKPEASEGLLALRVNGHGTFLLNDWSFGQLCSLSGAARDTVNRLRPETAAQVLRETLRGRVDDQLDLQALVFNDRHVRAVNGESYKRLWNAEVVALLQEFAVDFQPPQKAAGGGTGLYAGEQDMFAFMIDPTGWAEIGGEAFAPGFFVWNSEVGKRTVGISTFWFQAVCQNHIVWDATEVVEYTRRHSGRIREALGQIRAAIEALVEKRDERKDRFAHVIAKAMESRCGATAEDVQKLLAKRGFTRVLARKATELAESQGGFTIWSVVDALTRLARDARYAGSRTEADQKAASLLTLVGSGK